MKTKLAGSFSPPLTDAALGNYRAQISALPVSPLRDALGALLDCCDKWWALPESTGEGKLHAVGVGLVVDLDEKVAAVLEPHIPWDEEIAMIQGLCDAIPVDQTPLRDCAFHLLWHVKELALDREPMTSDKL